MNIARIIAIRESGHTQRAHTVPHHGEYKVDGHSWQLVTLLFLLHPAPTLPLIEAAQFHDSPERWAGDVPAPFKTGALRSSYEQVEANIFKALDLPDGSDLPVEDKAWLRACDILELWLWCHDQVALGNQNAKSFLGQINKHLSMNWDSLPGPVAQFIKEFSWQRTSEKGYWNEQRFNER